VPRVNAAREAAQARLASYEYEHLNFALKVLRVTEPTEIHTEAGGIETARPGALLIEWPTGDLLHVPAEEAHRFTPVVVEGFSDDATGQDEVLQPPAGHVEAAAAAAQEAARREAAAASPPEPETADEDRELTRGEILQKMRDAAAAQQRIIRAAQAENIISKNEADVWIRTGDVPDGVSIEETDEGIKVRREPGTSEASAH
jgi:hypothetical protein